MRQSKVELFAHLVWATKRREDCLTGSEERRVHRCVTAEAKQLGCEVLAVGGMPNHVHLLVRLPSTVCVSALAKQVKGVSSMLINEVRGEAGPLFRWQSGYGCFSVGPDQVDKIIGYVRNQREHHAAGDTEAAWEETDEEAPPRPATTTGH